MFVAITRQSAIAQTLPVPTPQRASAMPPPVAGAASSSSSPGPCTSAGPDVVAGHRGPIGVATFNIDAKTELPYRQNAEAFLMKLLQQVKIIMKVGRVGCEAVLQGLNLSFVKVQSLYPSPVVPTESRATFQVC